MGVLAIAGAETGATNEVTVVGTVTASTANWNFALGGTGGAYSYLFGTTVSTVAISFTVAAGASVYGRFYYRLGGSGGVLAFLKINDAGGLAASATIQSDNSITIQAAGGSSVNTGVFVAAASWHLWEFKYTPGSGANAVFELKYDGTVIGASTNGTHTVVPTNISIGAPITPCNVDDICIRDDQYPGPGVVLARQFKSGTPTYNAWTKTGAASIDLCWSNTPVSTATSAVATAANQAQTALTASFSATQTGHGTAVIGASDMINAMKIMAVAKRGTGSVTTHFIRFRYGGQDSGSVDMTGISTSDAYFQYYPNLSLSASWQGTTQGSFALDLAGQNRSAQSFAVTTTTGAPYTLLLFNIVKQAAPGSETYYWEIRSGSCTGTVLDSGSVVGAAAMNAFTGWLQSGVTYYFVYYQVGGSAANSVLYRTPSTYPSGNMWTSTDGGANWTSLPTQDWSFTVDYLAQVSLIGLNASEAGGVQGAASSQALTIEDMWVTVDVTPAVAPTTSIKAVGTVAYAGIGKVSGLAEASIGKVSGLA